ncbi:hypothetical protein [Paraburkholderia tuberum]|uniref:Uncharacterized protein n=1 Tax=Paraburkholderia tuberum TaxID=157910 RepID=A0A1H1JSC4_9BURK|nr:hypothetical protein [Paraburkholderia tuberum]SDR52903.1 hypothetical protein SAMN05445850_5569 [Paraburkholderia tuberum]
MEIIKVRPLRGDVLMPERGFRKMKGAGERVPRNTYYENLLRFGDIAQEPVTKAAKKRVSPANAAAGTDTEAN